jgi:hypothetical protein
MFKLFFSALACMFLAEIGCWLTVRVVDKGFPPGFFVNQSEIGYSGKPSWSGQVERIHSHTVSINSNVYLDDEWNTTLNEPHILMIGSTALFGLGVEKKDRISEQVSRHFGIGVHNAGMYGYGSPQALWALRNFCIGSKYSAILYFHEYKLTRDDFVKKISRIVRDNVLVTLPEPSDVVINSIKPTWLIDRLKFKGIRELLTKHDLSPRYIYENYLGLENFDEQYFLKNYSSTRDERIFPTSNIKMVVENIYEMKESAANCGAKFAIVLLPGPQENRFRHSEPATKKLLEDLGGKITVFDLRHSLPATEKIFLHGLDYFNPSAIDAFAQNLATLLKEFLKPH